MGEREGEEGRGEGGRFGCVAAKVCLGFFSCYETFIQLNISIKYPERLERASITALIKVDKSQG